MAEEFDIEFVRVDPNFVEEGVDLLPDQFRTKENIVKLAEYLLEAEDDYHRLIIQLAEIHRILDATGVYLDNVGNKLGVRRTSTNDNEYRNDILATTLGVRRNVTRDNIVSLLDEILGNGDIQVDFYSPNIVRISVYAPCPENIPSPEIIQNLFPIETSVSYASRDFKVFGFADNPNQDIVGGWGDGPNGARISNLIYQTEGTL